MDFGPITKTELHAFADASDDAIGADVYLRLTSSDLKVHVSYVISSSKLVPRNAVTTPRAELCACLEACQKLFSVVKHELATGVDRAFMYSYIKVVLGYIKNEEKRFSNYVTNRVYSILKIIDRSQWNYVPYLLRRYCLKAQDLSSLVKSAWLSGPEFLYNHSLDFHGRIGDYSEPIELPEALKDVSSMSTLSHADSLLSDILKRSSSLKKTLQVTSILLSCARRADHARQRCGMIVVSRSQSVTLRESEVFLLKQSQMESYGTTLARLQDDRTEGIASNDPLLPLNPFIDADGLLRVGGRPRNAWLPFAQKQPVILFHRHPLASLVILHFHEKALHQGRHLTSGALCDAGYHIHKGTKLLKNLLHGCVTCRRLRASPIQQKMADLPALCLHETPPFLQSGIDVFGPFAVTDGKTTRNSAGHKKMWDLLLTCMASRAVHVEPLYGLDISSLKNALRRFVSVRGESEHFYCDRGTNFVGASNWSESPDLSELQKETEKNGTQWHFNPPSASHHGVVWERKVGCIRRTLDLALMNLRGRLPSRDEFTTFMSEASSVVNNTPLWDVSSNPCDPIPLCPAMLLT